MRILQVASECAPFVKTGGLADAVAGLSAALAARGHEVAVVLPAFRGALPREASPLGKVAVAGAGHLWEATIWEHTVFPPQGVAQTPRSKRGWHGQASSPLRKEPAPPNPWRVWFVDIAPLYDREGTPYGNREGQDWWDNGERFAVLARAAAMLALGFGPGAIAGWRADVVHSHDWQAGLTSAFLRLLVETYNGLLPRTLFTIHNAAFQGWFPVTLFQALGLPDRWWDFRYLEAWGQLNFLKGGVTLSDVVTTVSPGYAAELLSGQGDYGLQGALAERANAGAFRGIVNGIDPIAWNPLADPYLAAPLAPGRRLTAAKRANRAALLARFGGEAASREVPLAGFVGRLTEQKGVDWLVAALPELLERHVLHFVLLGSGDPRWEREARALAARYPQRCFVEIGYDEALAHLIYGASDCFVMPSRFEPCGLAQLYAMRYGAVPVVRAVGGLRDTVIDASDEARGNGFLFVEAGAQPLAEALVRAYRCWHDQPRRWQKLVRNAMEGDYSWYARIAEYEALYQGERRN